MRRVFKELLRWIYIRCAAQYIYVDACEDKDDGVSPESSTRIYGCSKAKIGAAVDRKLSHPGQVFTWHFQVSYLAPQPLRILP